MKNYFPRVMLLLVAAAAAGYAQTAGSLGSVYNSSLAAGLAPADTIPLGVPTVDTSGVVSGASFQAGIVPGSWLTITGTQFVAGAHRTPGTNPSWAASCQRTSMA